VGDPLTFVTCTLHHGKQTIVSFAARISFPPLFGPGILQHVIGCSRRHDRVEGLLKRRTPPADLPLGGKKDFDNFSMFSVSLHM